MMSAWGRKMLEQMGFSASEAREIAPDKTGAQSELAKQLIADQNAQSLWNQQYAQAQYEYDASILQMQQAANAQLTRQIEWARQVAQRMQNLNPVQSNPYIDPNRVPTPAEMWRAVQRLQAQVIALQDELASCTTPGFFIQES